MLAWLWIVPKLVVGCENLFLWLFFLVKFWLNLKILSLVLYVAGINIIYLILLRSVNVQLRNRNGAVYKFYPRGVRVLGLVLLSVQMHTDKCFISGLLSVWIRTAICASTSHTIHTLAPTLTLILTLYVTLSLTLNPTVTVNLTLISSYLTNKHQYPQPISPPTQPNWMTSRLRDQSAASCKNCRPVPIGCTDNTRICQYAPYWQ